VSLKKKKFADQQLTVGLLVCLCVPYEKEGKAQAFCFFLFEEKGSALYEVVVLLFFLLTNKNSKTAAYKTTPHCIS